MQNDATKNFDIAFEESSKRQINIKPCLSLEPKWLRLKFSF